MESMDWYEPEVHELERARILSPLPANPVVFYGSSSIRLWSTLNRDLRSPRLVNLGFGGSTLAACVYFFERLVLPLQPASLLVYAGDNDLGDGRSPDDVVQSFRQLAGKVQQSCGTIPFGFLSIKPSPARRSILHRITETNQRIRRHILEIPGAFFVDLLPAMMAEDGNPRPDLFEEDGLHLSQAGYEVWTALLEPYRHYIFTENSPDRNLERIP